MIRVLGKTIGYFTELMQLLHPFMPFVTEEIWSDVRSEGDVELLLVREW
jgi:valyl-tRNA synthetase